MNTLYTSEGCSKCKIIKRQLDSAGIEYIENTNEKEMEICEIFSIPTLVNNLGQKFDFYNTTKYIEEYKRINK